MNMILTGAFQKEMDASSEGKALVSQLVSAWEKKNFKVARAGGVSLLALSLAACGSSDDTTTASDTSTDTSSTTSTTAVSQTFTLTAAIDSVTGGTGNDTINAGLNANSTQTLSSLDTIDGGGGTDTLNVILNSAGTYTPALTSVESMSLTTSAAVTMDFLGGASVTTIKSTGATGTVTLNNISATSTGITVQNTNQNHTIDYTAVAVVGTADSATVGLYNVTGGTLSVDLGVESLTITSTGGANTTGATTIGANSLTISGSEALTLGGTITTAETIDASAATGKITLTSNNINNTSITTGSAVDAVTVTGGSAVTETISLGAGSDKLTFTANLADADVLDGGDGTDTLVGTSANLNALTSTTSTSNVSNFEAISVSNEFNAGNGFDVSDVQEDGITTINLLNKGTGAAVITNAAESITGEAGSLTINLGASGAGNVADLANNLTVVDTGSALTDSVTINNLAKNTTNNNSVDVTDGVSITSTGYENVTFGTGSGNADVPQTLGTVTITPDSVAGAVSYTVTGGNSTDIATSLTTTSTAGVTVDASGMTAQAAGTVTFDLAAISAGSGATITGTGSAGDDSFGASGAALGNFASTINAGAGADGVYSGTSNDTINGEAGNDTIDASSGNDTVDGGGGNDTVIISADANLSVLDSYVGGAGTDTIQFSADMTDAASTLSKISGFEILHVAAGAAETFTMSNFVNNTDFTRIDFADGGGNTLTVNNVSDTVTTIRLVAAAAADTPVIDRLTDTASNSLIVSVRADLDNAGGGTDLGGFTAADEETISVSGSTAANDVDFTAMTVGDLVTLNVSGAADVDTGAISSTKIATIDASGSSAANNILATNSVVAMTVTGGTGADTLSTGSGNDTINGGLGVDTINGGAGNDTIGGGEGADQITSGDGSDTLTGGAGAEDYLYTVAGLASEDGDTITDFAVGAAGDAISVDVTTTGTGGAENVEEITGVKTTQADIKDGDIIVSGGGTAVDVSGDATADLAAINAVFSDADAVDAGSEFLIVFNADTDGNGNADEIQVWYGAGHATIDQDVDSGNYIATLSNITATVDLANMTGGDFNAANFELT
jgi:Ca2+-binding RTX toxin-like protein